MKNLIGIKTKNGIYIAEITSDGTFTHNSLRDLLVNKKIPEKTFHRDWFMIDKEPKMIQCRRSQRNINYRYELKDKTLESLRTPLIFEINHVTKNTGCDWKEEYAMFESLYTLSSDKQSDILEDIKFNYKTIMVVTKINGPGNFEFDAEKGQEIRENDIEHQIFDKIVFPDIILASTPSSLTSRQSYDIVRQYIKQNIDYDVASITSDYNFCFTVKKKIPLSEPEKYSVDVNDLWMDSRKCKPKYEMRYKKNRKIECFAMAPAPYQDYEIIKGFRGKNQNDLKENIEAYCSNLIAFINKPLKDCPHCKGSGIVFDDDLKFD